MTQPRTNPSSSERKADYRRGMRADGLRPLEIWLPDVNDPAFIEKCRAQAQAIAASDPAGDELMDFVAGFSGIDCP